MKAGKPMLFISLAFRDKYSVYLYLSSDAKSELFASLAFNTNEKAPMKGQYINYAQWALMAVSAAHLRSTCRALTFKALNVLHKSALA
jgi:hypothetical protein